LPQRAAGALGRLPVHALVTTGPAVDPAVIRAPENVSVRQWARYVSWTPSRHRLRFTKTGEENLERAYRTHWISPELMAAERRRKAQTAVG